MQLPKQIFIYWSTGHDNSPELVKQCVASWERLNPNWNIILIDDENTNAYINMDKYYALKKRIYIQAYSDILRLELINQLGGIWADATLFCCTPLDQWINCDLKENDLITQKLYPLEYRCMTNSFIASNKDNYMLRIMLDRFVDYCNSHPIQRASDYDSKIKKKTYKVLKKILNKKRITTLLWLNPIINKWLGITPYFIFMHLWYYLTIHDKKFASLWKASHSVPNPSRVINRKNMHREITQKQIKLMSNTSPSFIKLDWKQKPIPQENISCVEYLYSLNDKK